MFIKSCYASWSFSWLYLSIFLFSPQSREISIFLAIMNLYRPNLVFVKDIKSNSYYWVFGSHNLEFLPNQKLPHYCKTNTCSKHPLQQKCNEDVLQSEKCTLGADQNRKPAIQSLIVKFLKGRLQFFKIIIPGSLAEPSKAKGCSKKTFK